MNPLLSPLPSGYAELDELLKKWALGISGELEPPDESAVQRLRRELAELRAQGRVTLPKSLWRQLPYAWFMDDAAPLDELYPDWADRYWQVLLPTALRRGRFTVRRWISPAITMYCHGFKRADQSFARYARQLDALIGRHVDLEKSIFRQWRDQFRFFSPEQVCRQFPEQLLKRTEPIRMTVEQWGLPDGLLDSRLGSAVFEGALQQTEADLRQMPLVRERLLAWADSLTVPVAHGPHAVSVAHAVLMPWQQTNPTPELRKFLMNWLLERYGDPRLGQARVTWAGVSESAQQVMLRWLAGDSLVAFLKVLERTGDDIFEFRKRFWTAYFDRNYIEDAWLVLGKDAVREYRRLYPDQAKHRRFGVFERGGGVKANQSALLMRMGKLVFAEWSHDGALRAYNRDDPPPNHPRLYRWSYHADELRFDSMDFHPYTYNQKPYLVHSHSERGTWQTKAHDFICRHLGDVKLSPSDYLG